MKCKNKFCYMHIEQAKGYCSLWLPNQIENCPIKKKFDQLNVLINEISDFDIMLEIDEELRGAIEKFPAFNSYHEGYAVIKEEIDELWDEVKKKNQNKCIMRKEALQVATMAIRFILDLTNDMERE